MSLMPKASEISYVPEIKPIIDVVPEPGASNNIASPRALFDANSVRALAVFAWVTVVVAVDVDDLVVAGGTCKIDISIRCSSRNTCHTLNLDAGFVVVMGDESFIVVVGRISTGIGLGKDGV
jgi:hypothetical protein